MHRLLCVRMDFQTTSSACFSASEARVAAHGFTRGIRGVCELVHALKGLEHPEITRKITWCWACDFSGD